MKFLKITITAAFVIIFSGCATIVSKSEYPITISTKPDSANITVTDETGTTVYSGESPATLTLPTKKGYFKGKDYTATFQKDGYPEQVANIERTVDGWFIGNIVFGGFIGWLIVDPLSGAMWKLDQDIYMDLETGSTINPASEENDGEEASAVNQSIEGLNIVMIDDVPEQLRDKMVRIQ